MTAKTQTIPEADDIAQLSKEDASKLFLARVEEFSTGSVPNPVSLARKLWPCLARQAGLGI
jgi:hypothetical protein